VRVWLLGDQTEYESTTLHGVFASPNLAWDALFEQVHRRVFEGFSDRFEMYVGADQSAPDPTDPKRGILVMIRHGRVSCDHEIWLAGEHVTGTNGDAPTRGEWQDLQQVASLLRLHATSVAGFVCTDEEPNRLATGRWHYRRDDV
jgi:hypothetical protein